MKKYPFIGRYVNPEMGATNLIVMFVKRNAGIVLQSAFSYECKYYDAFDEDSFIDTTITDFATVS